MLYQLATIKVAHMAVIFHLPETVVSPRVV
jgi:hypothetical protein